MAPLKVTIPLEVVVPSKSYWKAQPQRSARVAAPSLPAKSESNRGHFFRNSLVAYFFLK